MTARSPSCASSRLIRRCISSLLWAEPSVHCGVGEPGQQQIVLVARWPKHAVRDAESAEAIPGIFLVSVATGSKHRLTKTGISESGDWSPAYSRDGRSLVFQRNAGSARSTLLYSASVRHDGNLRGPPSRVPLDVADLASYGSWSNGGRALILARASGLFRNAGRKPVTTGKVTTWQPASVENPSSVRYALA